MASLTYCSSLHIIICKSPVSFVETISSSCSEFYKVICIRESIWIHGIGLKCVRIEWIRRGHISLGSDDGDPFLRRNGGYACRHAPIPIWNSEVVCCCLKGCSASCWILSHQCLRMRRENLLRDVSGKSIILDWYYIPQREPDRDDATSRRVQMLQSVS